jgi:hypothetical protein
MAKDYPSARDCEHGQLRRACPICETEKRLAELDRIIANIRVHFEQLCSDDLRQHGYIAHDHDIDFQVFRALCGYKEALVERMELQEAVRWERECTETGRWISVAACFDYRLDVREIAEMQTCARAAVDALVGEG